jgi:gamma-D-glutamyl-L-lysine dipeptidyl-peptidase
MITLTEIIMKYHMPDLRSVVARNFGFALILASFLPSCIPAERNASIQASVEREAEEIRKTTVPDRRMGVFQFVKDDNGIITAFETDNPTAEVRVDSLLKAKGFENIPIQPLPDPVLGDTIHAVVRVGVANLRREPRHGAELVDQTIMGTRLKILRRQGGWVQVQTPYKYLGWMTLDSATPMTTSEITLWESGPKTRVNAVNSGVYEKMDPMSLKMSDLSMNAIVTLVQNTGSWSQVKLPDGRTGFAPTADLDTPITTTDRVPAGWEVVQTATQFHGIPYLWGGNSSRGLDCSGYTQTVFAANGFLLPRDANMQVEVGMDVPIDSAFSNVVPGDLLFFGENDRITHVAISMGGPRFIHASTYVMMNSLSPSDPDFSEFRRRTLQKIKRLESKQENM